MTEFWTAVIIGSLAVYSWKILGYLIPKSYAQKDDVVVFAARLTVALLAALTAVQTFAVGQRLVIDSRLAAIALAALLYWRKLPFIVVVAIAAGFAAALRFFLHWA